MTRPLLRLTALAATLFWSGAAIAQDRPAGPPPEGGPPGNAPPEPGLRGGRLFISSAGEPFRGPEGLKRWFDSADADHDGVLTLSEFRADFMRYFAVLDANHDGVIDGIENGLYETQIAPEITRMGPAEPSGGPPRSGRGGPPGGGGGQGGGPGGGMGGGPGGGMGGGGMGRGGGGGEGFTQRPRGAGGGMARREGAARFSLLNIPQPIRGADANLDWKVTAEEWSKAAGQRFALLDVNADGKLTLDTLPALPGRGGPDGRERRDHQQTPPRNQN